MSRRSFFRQLGGFGVATVAAPDEWAFASAPRDAAASPLGLHPFIEAHPEAVFIRRTKVAAKTDAEAIRREALALARQVFALRKGPGLALTPTVAIKPNLTSTKKTRPDPRDRHRPLRRRGPRRRPEGARDRPAGRSSSARA